jgi:hypothetical protein
MQLLIFHKTMIANKRLLCGIEMHQVSWWDVPWGGVVSGKFPTARPLP